MECFSAGVGKAPLNLLALRTEAALQKLDKARKRTLPYSPRGDAVLQSPDLSSGNFILGFYLPQLEGNKCVLFQATELMTLCNKRKVTQWLKVFTIATEEGQRPKGPAVTPYRALRPFRGC